MQIRGDWPVIAKNGGKLTVGCKTNLRANHQKRKIILQNMNIRGESNPIQITDRKTRGPIQAM